MTFNNGSIVVVDVPIKWYEHLGTNWIANYQEWDDSKGWFKLLYNHKHIYCKQDELYKIHEITVKQLMDMTYNNEIHWIDADCIPPTKPSELIEDNTILHTSFDTNNSENDSIIIKSFADNSALLKVETLENNNVASLEVDLPFSAVKKLKSALDAIIDLEGVNK